METTEPISPVGLFGIIQLRTLTGIEITYPVPPTLSSRRPLQEPVGEGQDLSQGLEEDQCRAPPRVLYRRLSLPRRLRHNGPVRPEQVRFRRGLEPVHPGREVGPQGVYVEGGHLREVFSEVAGFGALKPARAQPPLGQVTL